MIDEPTARATNAEGATPEQIAEHQRMSTAERHTHARRATLRLTNGEIIHVSLTARDENVLVSGTLDSALIPVDQLTTHFHENGYAAHAVTMTGEPMKDGDDDDEQVGRV